jgi:hypothetical protein
MLASLASIRRRFVIEVPLYARAAITPEHERAHHL